MYFNKKWLIALFVAGTFVSEIFGFPNKEVMNSKVGSVSAELNNSVFTKPKENLPSLVNYLVKDQKDQSGKVRVIHDWICNNIAYDTDMYFSGRISKQDYVSVLKKQKGVCSGYSAVFLEMCKNAGIEAIGIHGWSKGFGFNGRLDAACAHEWNAVKIGNNWRLVDCCWDAGYVEIRTFIKNYSTQYYFLSAEAFIYSHLPEKDEYQYLPESKIRSKEQFMKEPYLPGKFFKYGFELTDKSPDYNNLIDGAVTYSLKSTKTGVETSSAVRGHKDKKIVDGIDWIESSGNIYSYEFDVPDRNDYEAYIFAKNSSDINYPDKFSISEFEQQILPQAESIISSKPIAGKTISQKDYDLFKESFFKVPDNNNYYYKENLFNAAQIKAVSNIFKILNIQNGYLEPVLTVNLMAADGYEGCGFDPKYPNVYSSYKDAKNTFLLSPKQYSLTGGERYHFEFSSKNFQKFVIILNDEWNFFEKNPTTGNFELELEIPSDSEDIVVYGSSNGKNYSGLVEWQVE